MKRIYKEEMMSALKKIKRRKVIDSDTCDGIGMSWRVVFPRFSTILKIDGMSGEWRRIQY